MSPRLGRVIIAALALCLLPCRGFAQTGTAGPASCAIFTIQDLSSTSDTKDYEQTITDSISATFQVTGFDLVPPGEWRGLAQKLSIEPSSLVRESEALSLAAAVKARVAVSGFFVVRDDQIYIALQVWDVPGAKLLTGIQKRAPFNLAFYSALHEWVAEMLPEIKRLGAERAPPAAMPSTPAVPPAVVLETVSAITFLSRDEGMEVLLAGDLRVGSITDGRLTWAPAGLAPGIAFRVLKRKQGFHDAWETVHAAPEIRLASLVQKHSSAMEVDWTYGQLLGLGATARRYVTPDSLFLFLGGYIYAQPPLTSAGHFVYHGDASLGFGGYIFLPPQAWVRLGLSSGVGAVFSSPVAAGLPWSSDLYINLLNWWIETRAIGPVIFLRQEWKFTTGVGNNLLGIGWMNVLHVPPFTLGVRFEW